MAWRIGVDEAGYGPNLGPLVMTAVACRLPDDLAQTDLWQLLSAAVRRERSAGDKRLLVNDSKEVFSTARGLAELETGVLALLRSLSLPGRPTETLANLLQRLCPAHMDELNREIWFHGGTNLPLATDGDRIEIGANKLLEASGVRELHWGPIRSVIVCPSRFNDLVDRWDSKAAVLALGLVELMRHHLAQNENDAVHVVVDKHGGRNRYSAIVQEAAGAGMTLAVEEGAERSVYEVTGLDHPLRMTFRPRADSADMCVALASMISKYLRELLMGEFNDFWRQHLPALVPTAGYPVDAGRFFADIRPIRERLGVPDRRLWRQR